MAPGVIAGGLLAFIISLGNFIITNFVKGAGMETLPTAIYGLVKQGGKPNILAISTLMRAVSILFVTLFYVINRKKPPSRLTAFPFKMATLMKHLAAITTALIAHPCRRQD